MSTRSLGAAVAAAAILLAGCAGGTSTDTGPAPTGSGATRDNAPGSESFNRADVSFARNMIPHHRQAVTMADMVAGRTTDPALLDLASTIRAAQKPEITTMTTWLEKWNAVPPDSGTSGHHMTGMMSGADMASLRQARGTAFDEMWLRMMIEHHKGAVTMARTELEKGRHDGARKLAQEIIDAQKAEIARMRGMLDKP